MPRAKFNAVNTQKKENFINGVEVSRGAIEKKTKKGNLARYKTTSIDNWDGSGRRRSYGTQALVNTSKSQSKLEAQTERLRSAYKAAKGERKRRIGRALDAAAAASNYKMYDQQGFEANERRAAKGRSVY